MRQRLVSAIVGLLVVALAATYAVTALRPPPPDVIEGPGGWLFPGWEHLADERPRATRQGVELVVRTQDRLRRQGRSLVVLLVPYKGRVAPEQLPRNRQSDVRRSDGYERLVADLRSKGVTVVDALPTLQALHRAGAAAYPDHDAHWFPAAAEVVADQVAAVVATRGPLAGQPGDGEALSKWIVETRYPDLVLIQRRQGDMRYPQVGQRLRDYTVPPTQGTPAADIVGSSFSDRFYGLPQRLSHDLDRRVFHYVAFGAPGSWQAMADYLRRKDGPKAPVVVWQFGEASFSDRSTQTAMATFLGAPD